MTKKFALLFLSLLILLVAGLVYFTNQRKEESLPKGLLQLRVGKANVNAEVADSPEKIRQGLSGRSGLDKDSGMYFILPQEDIETFWMKDMLFSIDIIWVNGEKIVGIVRNAPLPKSDDVPTFTSPTSVTHVLEVNAGFADKHNLKIGDAVKIGNQKIPSY